MRSRIRLAIFGGLLLLQALSVTTLVIVSGRQINQSETEYTNALLQAAVADSAQEVAALVAPAENVVSVTARVAAQAEFDPTTQAGVLLATMSELPQLAGLFVGWADGDFVYVTRNDDGYRVKIITVDGEERSVSILVLDTDGELISASVDSLDIYDPRLRPWYTEAVDALGETIWTDPYVFFTSGELGTTTARAISDGGPATGVVGADIELISLSEHLQASQLAHNVHSLIFNDQGTVVAHPDPDSTRQLGRDGFESVRIDELESAAERDVARLLPSVSDGTVSSYIDEQGQPARIATDSVPIGTGEWRLAVFGRRAELEAALTPGDGQRQRLVILVAALSVVLFVLIAIPATQPIRTLHQLADTDTLTGLPNRRAVLRIASHAATDGQQRAIAMIDLDRFKSINDTHGHAVGDVVLAEAADRLVGCLRGDATVGRIGGEEFMVTFSALSPEHVAQVGERIRRAIDRPIETVRGRVDLTTSVGMAIVTGEYAVSDLLAAADGALLEAKESGRNRVVIRDLSGRQPARARI